MAISRQKKEELLAKYNEQIEQSSAMFLTSNVGISVNQMTELRKKLREVDGNYSIVKNTLAKKALNDAGISVADDMFEGPVGIGFSLGDAPPVAKALVDFAKDNERLELKAGLLDGRLLTLEEVESLADLPPLEVIRAQLLGVISAPASQLVGVVASGVRQVINVVNAYAESENDGETAAA